MRQSFINLYLITVVLIMGCTSCSDSDGEELASDSSSFEQTKGMADSLFNCMQFRDAYDLYLQLLNSKEAAGNSEKRLSVLNSLCNASELSGHKAEEDEWLEQMLDLATQTRNSYYRSMGLIKMGQNVFYEGDHEQGIQYVGEAIDLIEKNDRSDADHLTHSYLILLARLYGEMKDYDTALKTNEQNLQLTMQGTRWGTAQNQQLIDRRMALAKMAAILARMGNFQRADSAYAAWKAVKYEGNHTRDYFIVDYLKRRGRYQEAIPIYHDLIRRVRQQGDTLGEMMNTAKWGLAEVYRKMGNCEKAAILYEQVLEIQDTLKSRKAKNSAQQLAAVYHDKEQDQVIMEQKAENTRQKAILTIELLVLLGIAALALVVIVKNRAIRHKNRLLAQQIADALKYKEKYLKEKNANTPMAAVADLGSLSDEQLYHYIDNIVISEHLFTDPTFGRDSIMQRFSLSKERVGAIFAKGSTHAKMSNYIQQLRLEYAALLLTEHTDRNIAQIATDSGFSSSAYFSNCFRQHFGMSPSDYRRESTETRDAECTS